MTEIEEFWKNDIDGAWVEGGAGRIDVTDPATGKPLAQQALADANDVDLAVQAACRVHLSGDLTAMRPIERGRMVQAMGRFLLEHKDQIARVLTLEQGKPLWEAETEVEGAALYFEYYGNQASTVEGRSIPSGSGYFDWTENEPFGVSAQIIPWNYPVEMTARSLSAALATGNACVIKSPELTPLTNAWFARAAEAAGFPSGTVNVQCGLGHEAGAALAGHADVNQIVFTGSAPTGVAIATAAAQNVAPCVLERAHIAATYGESFSRSGAMAERIDAESTRRLREKVEAAHSDKRVIHGVLDNARYHHAKALRPWLEAPDRRVRLLFLPAYAPHLNAIESLWGVMHEHVTQNRCHDSFDDFTEAIRSFFRETLPRNWRSFRDRITDNFRVISHQNHQLVQW